MNTVIFYFISLNFVSVIFYLSLSRFLLKKKNNINERFRN